MGVTYKLKKEVVKYILRQKQDNPQISCRKLVIAVQSEFGVNVSKSSINAVIKEAHLSSPVGRTPTDLSRSQKFAIPKEKKAQLFGDEFSAPEKDEQERQDDTKFGPSILITVKPNDHTHGKMSLSVNSPSALTLPQFTKNEDLSDIRPNLPQEPELATSQEKVTLRRDVVEIQNEICEETFHLDHLRPFFLRLALWEFFSKPVLEEFFKRHTSLGENEIRIVDVLACFSPRSLNAPFNAMDPQNSWLWKISGWEELPETEDVEAVERFLATTKISKFDFLLELGYFCSLVSSVRFILSNDQYVLVDGRYLSVDSSASKRFPVCPIERAVEETARFISGNNILTLRCSTPEKVKEIIARLHSCLSINHKNLVKKIILMGLQDDQLLEFDQIANKPRNFIISSAIPESDFESLFGVPLEFIPEQILEMSDAQYMFSDKMVELLEKNSGDEMKDFVRMVVFKRQGFGSLEVSLTNIPQTAFTARELQSMVLGSWRELSENTVVESNPIILESLFASNDADFFIKEAIENLIVIIEENMNLMFLQIGKESNYFTNVCNQKGCVTVGPRNIKLHVKSSNVLNSQGDADFSDVLNTYRTTTCNLKYKIMFS